MKNSIETERNDTQQQQTKASTEQLESLARLARYHILKSTFAAQSGHPTSSLSATELILGLLFGGTFRYNVSQPDHPNNDRLIFSKGHASPLLYSAWMLAGQLEASELGAYRHFGSPLEGHPSPDLSFVEAATGSLGQGLSIGLGMALNAKHVDRLPYRTYVLIGDGEMAEGSQWEAIELARHYELDNLTGILDVNRLGQCGETLYGHDLEAYQRRLEAFGWETIPVDGHSFPELLEAYERASKTTHRPSMIIARTIKGQGVSQIADRPGWHGKALDEETYESAIQELGELDHSVRGTISNPSDIHPTRPKPTDVDPPEYELGAEVATRTAYGNALDRLYPAYPQIVSLDGEVSNSTRSEALKQNHPERFFEMYIAEQNMVGAALGLSKRGKIPFVSSFAAFLTRAFDQIRMARYSDANIKFVGSHAGVSIGQDGPSQMGLEDMAMFRTILDGVVLHPCDAVSMEQLTEAAARHVGIVYLRTMRQKTPVIYGNDQNFTIGGSRVLRSDDQDVATVVATGATVHEALRAHETLVSQGLHIRVIDAYSVKPIDTETLQTAALETPIMLTVEDHFAEGGLGEAVLSALSTVPVPIHVMAVRKKPTSGTPDELRDFEEISSDAIVRRVKQALRV